MSKGTRTWRNHGISRVSPRIGLETSVATPRTAPGTTLGFVSVLDSSGSSLRWSTLLRNAKSTALAVTIRGMFMYRKRVSGQRHVRELTTRRREPQGRRR